MRINQDWSGFYPDDHWSSGLISVLMYVVTILYYACGFGNSCVHWCGLNVLDQYYYTTSWCESVITHIVSMIHQSWTQAVSYVWSHVNSVALSWITNLRLLVFLHIYNLVVNSAPSYHHNGAEQACEGERLPGILHCWVVSWFVIHCWLYDVHDV